MVSTISLTLLIFSSLLIQSTFSLRSGDCEVCIGVVNKLIESLSGEEKSNPTAIEEKLVEFCTNTKKSENRFCYYIGALEESATKIVSELSKPLSWGLPAEKICEKLQKKDSQICELRYEKVIDLNNVDLKKLRVRDLKKILNDWDEVCEGCIEKAEFIKRVEQLKPKYTKQEL